MKKLAELTAACKASVSLSINQHRNYYQSVLEYLQDRLELDCISDEISQEVLAEMISRDTVIDLQFYPDTPTGFYTVLGYNLDMVLDEALEIIRKRRSTKLPNA